MAVLKFTEEVLVDFENSVPREAQFAVYQQMKRWSLRPHAAIKDADRLPVPPNAYVKKTPRIAGVIYTVSFIYPYGPREHDIFRITGLSSNRIMMLDIRTGEEGVYEL